MNRKKVVNNAKIGGYMKLSLGVNKLYAIVSKRYMRSFLGQRMHIDGRYFYNITNVTECCNKCNVGER